MSQTPKNEIPIQLDQSLKLHKMYVINISMIFFPLIPLAVGPHRCPQNLD